MGFAKYYEDNIEINYNRISLQDKATQYRVEWYRERREADRKLKEIHSAELTTERVLELMKIRDALNLRKNLTLTAKLNCESTILGIMIDGLNEEFQSSYERITETIDEMAKNEKPERDYSVYSNMYKKPLIEHLIYCVFDAINNTEEICQEEMDEILNDIRRLIIWYNNDDLQLGRINSDAVSNQELMMFMGNTLGISREICPHCNEQTVTEVKYCMLCAKEIKK